MKVTLNDVLGLQITCDLCNPEKTDTSKYAAFFNDAYLVSRGRKPFTELTTGNDYFCLCVKEFLKTNVLRRGIKTLLENDYKADFTILYGLVKKLTPDADLDKICEECFAITKTGSDFLKWSVMAFLEVVDERYRRIQKTGAA